MERNRQPRTQRSAAHLAAMREAARNAVARLHQRQHTPRPRLRQRFVRGLRVAIWRALQAGVLALALALIVIAIGAALPLPRPAPARAAAVTVIEDVTVIDPRDGSARDRQTIVLAGTRIASVMPAIDAQIPEGALRIDGRGRFAIPGLWDMHAHTLALSPQLHFPLLIAHGITSIRDLGDGCSWTGNFDCEPEHVAWRAQRDAGTLLAPHLVATASYRMRALAQNENEPTWRLQAYARNTVAELKARGDEVLDIQLDSRADPREFVALLDEARTRHIAVVARVPYRVDLLQSELEALDSIERQGSLLPQCSRHPARLTGGTLDWPWLLQRFDAKRCAGVLARLARYRVAYVPAHAAAAARDRSLTDMSSHGDIARLYVLSVQRALWRVQSAWATFGHGQRERELRKQLQRAEFALTHQAVDAQVSVLAGSDALAAGTVHGFGLHDELEVLVQAGLTPTQVLRSATWLSAQHVGMGAQSGLIEAGRDADLLLLDADPRADIRHTRRINVVVMRGAVYRRDDLDRLLAFSRQQARSFVINCRFLWNILTA